MTESAQDVLDRLDMLVEAAMVDDHNYLIDVLEQYDVYMKTRKPNMSGVFTEKFTTKMETNGEIAKNCCVDIKRLPDAVIERYLQKTDKEEETNGEDSDKIKSVKNRKR